MALLSALMASATRAKSSGVSLRFQATDTVGVGPQLQRPVLAYLFVAGRGLGLRDSPGLYPPALLLQAFEAGALGRLQEFLSAAGLSAAVAAISFSCGADSSPRRNASVVRAEPPDVAEVSSSEVAPP